MKELNQKIITWAKERGIDEKGTIEGQAIKSVEEISELIKGISKDDLAMIKDSVGDVYVTLVIGVLITFKDEGIMDVFSTMPELDDDCIVRFRQVGKADKMLDALNLMRVFQDTYLGNTSYWQDSIVSAIRLLKVICKGYDLCLVDCIESAYEEISGRKGKMVNGVFVKEGDLK